MAGDPQRLKLLVGPHPATLRNDKDLYGMQKVRGSNPLSSTREVFTFQWGLFSRLGLTFRHSGGRWSVAGIFGRAPGPGPLVCPVSGRAVARLWRLSWLVVMGAGLVVVVHGVVRAAWWRVRRGSCGAVCGFSGGARRRRGGCCLAAGCSRRRGCAGCGRRAGSW